MNQQTKGATFSRQTDRIRLRLDGPSRPTDRRTKAIRPDLADVAEATHHLAPHYAAPFRRACVAAAATVTATPDAGASATTQLLHGEGFHVLDVRGGWAWGYCAHDHYVGYVPADALGPVSATAPTHRICPPGAPLFRAPDIKAPVALHLPAGAVVEGSVEGDFLATANGFVHLRHVRALAEPEQDWADVATRYLGQPYVWGGRGHDGLDCSGLVQVALAACGHAVPRDTDQQAGRIGRALAEGEPLMRGDLVYFPGHVGIMVDAATLLHANAHWMRVTAEPLADVIERLRPVHAEPVTARRRIDA